MQQFQFIVPVTFSEQQRAVIQKQFSKIFSGVRTGDKNNFDKFCHKIYPFCLEIYENGKDLPPYDDIPETPFGMAIYSVGANISADILPFFKNYLPRSDALHEMVCHVVGEDKFADGRRSFLTEIWPKTKRIEGVNIKKLITEPVMGGRVVEALLKFKDGRFVEEAKKYQSRFPNDWNKKKIALYIERYGTK